MAEPFGPLFPIQPPARADCAVAIKAARAKLRSHPRPTGSVWSLLGAAALFAGAGVAFAAAVILGPPHLAIDPDRSDPGAIHRITAP